MFANLDNVVVFLVPIFFLLGFFTCLTVFIWALQRRKERESYYRYELARKAVEKGAVSEAKVLELLRADATASWRGRVEGLKLAGIVTLAIGAGLLFGLRFVEGVAVWQVGWIPIGLGAGLLVYSLLLAPRPARDRNPEEQS